MRTLHSSHEMFHVLSVSEFHVRHKDKNNEIHAPKLRGNLMETKIGLSEKEK